MPIRSTRVVSHGLFIAGFVGIYILKKTRSVRVRQPPSILLLRRIPSDAGRENPKPLPANESHFRWLVAPMPPLPFAKFLSLLFLVPD